MGIWRYGRRLVPTKGQPVTAPRCDRPRRGHRGSVREPTTRCRARGAEPRGWHVPVLLERCLELLAPGPASRPQSPCTSTRRWAWAGHAEAVLAAHPAVTLIGLDRDPQALARAARAAGPYADRVHLVHAVYDELPEVLARLGWPRWTVCCSTSGVSSMQLDEAAAASRTPRTRRWTCGWTRPPGSPPRRWSTPTRPRDLARVLRVYGEEKFAGRIAAAIVRERDHGAASPRSARLAELVRDAIPAAARRTGGHPAKRTFQALRIEVNGELAALEAALPAALDALAVGRADRRAVLPLAGGPDRQAGVRRAGPVDRAGRPAGGAARAPGRRCGCSPGAPSSPTEAEVAANPRAARCGCARPSGSIRTPPAGPGRPCTNRRAPTTRAGPGPGPPAPRPPTGRARTDTS